MLLIDFNNQTKFRIAAEEIKKLLASAKKTVLLRKKQNISLAFVSPSIIRSANKRYRRQDRVTDVLSFSEKGLSPKDENFLGEILICPVRAREQAKEFRQSLTAEINRLALHGYLHLLGYDHVRRNDAKKMETLEKKVLEKFYD